MPDTPEHEIPLDSAGRITRDVSCRRCDYNLRGLAIDDVCPECSAAIALSVRGDLLQFADPAWVRTLASGVRWILISVLLTIARTVGAAVIPAMLATRMPALRSSMGMATLSALLSVVPSIFMVLGVWRLTTPEPCTADAPQRTLGARRLARGLIPVLLVATPLRIVGTSMMALVANGAVPARAMVAFVCVATPLVGVLALIALAAAFVHARSLARRLPGSRLAAQTRVVMWGFVGSKTIQLGVWVLLLVLIPTLMSAPAPTGPFDLTMTTLMIAGFAQTAGLVVFTSWLIVLLFLYAAAFRRVAGDATVS